MITERYSDKKLAEITIGERKKWNSTIILTDYDSTWPLRFKEIERIIRKVLGDMILLLEHVGSTSVPGLSAKPIIDIVLEIQNSTKESNYVPALESKEFKLRIREPDWYEHRLLKITDANLHVFSANCMETERMLKFRDWLRSNPDDKMLYQTKKVELSKKVWKYRQNYADAKTAVIQEILAKVDSCEGDG
jgi:GrpB-like predicted nucleotidyltransferase (UPF0157 family)